MNEIPGEIPGDAEAMDRLAGRFTRFAANADEASHQLDAIDASHWSGDAADRFLTAVERLPRELRGASVAFAAAEGALRDYAAAVREGKELAARSTELSTAARAATQAWEEAGALGPDPGADDRAQAQRLLRQATDHVDTVAHQTAARLTAAARQAPAATADVLPGGLPAVRAGDATIHAVTSHPLSDAHAFAGGAGDSTTALRYGAAHHVGFADGTNGSTSWDGWVDGGADRGIGQVTPEVLAALGLGVLGVAAAARRRRTAMATAGIEPADLAARRPARAGAIGGVAARLRDGHTRGAWRTNLARLPHHSSLPPRLPAGVDRPADAPIVVAAESAIRHDSAR